MRVLIADADPQVRETLARQVRALAPTAQVLQAHDLGAALTLQPGGTAPAQVAATGRLTPRQLQVLQLVMQGHPNKLIARALGLTEGTVKIHVAAVLRALQARNRTDAVVVARRLGIAG